MSDDKVVRCWAGANRRAKEAGWTIRLKEEGDPDYPFFAVPPGGGNVQHFLNARELDRFFVGMTLGLAAKKVDSV